jgi:DNA-binding CsgD family transcriptional regulator
MAVFGPMCRGLAEKEIGAILGVTRKAVNDHTRSIYRKFGVGNRLEFHRKVGFLE